MSDAVIVNPPADKFQSRDDLVQYIEQQTTTALEKALGLGAVRVERRVPRAARGRRAPGAPNGAPDRAARRGA